MKTIYRFFGFSDDSNVGKRALVDINRHVYVRDDEILKVVEDILDAMPPAVRVVTDGRTIVSTAGTRVQLGSTENAKRAHITALETNSGTVVIGGETVIADQATRRGQALGPGDSITLETDKLSKVWLDATQNGDGVTYVMEGYEGS